MGKDYVTFSKTKVPEGRYFKVLPYSINAARDILYQEPNSSNSYMFDPNRSSPYFKHLGYGCYDLKKLYDLSDKFIEAEENWLKTKDSNAFIPDKLLSLYKYAVEFDKTTNKTDIDIYKDKDFCEDRWSDQISLFRSSEKCFSVTEYLSSDDGEKTVSKFNTLKEAFVFITGLIKDNQHFFTEFRVKADEDYYINRFVFNFTPDARHNSDHLDHTYHPYSELRDEEKSVIKAAAEELTKVDFFLNAYYFQYVHEEVQGRYNKRSDVSRTIETERVLAKTQQEAEDIFYKKYPKSCKVNCALWESYRPLSFQNKSDIEDCERKIEMYKEKLEKLKKETPKDLVKVETDFDS